ncbi:hypothetical protein NDU88_000839 [Pleurodeles waltl]|uniref:Uncharacterized protein n=1 Tax=Pleurodeles waltl TaxID=8319 RepID=A0AAV7NDE4_PLEWA|nr:hypothetical protein NDU88_000839 [Pleurodeles waltl]
MTKRAQPEEGFLNPIRLQPAVGRILQMPLTATRRPQWSRNQKTPEPGHQRRQQREDFPDARWEEQEATKRTDRPCSEKSVA